MCFVCDQDVRLAENSNELFGAAGGLFAIGLLLMRVDFWLMTVCLLVRLEIVCLVGMARLRIVSNTLLAGIGYLLWVVRRRSYTNDWL